MFPNISKETGLDLFKKHVDKRIYPIFSMNCTVNNLEITLDNSIPELNGKTICQIKGTAMGKNACVYADTAINKIGTLHTLFSFHPLPTTARQLRIFYKISSENCEFS